MSSALRTNSLASVVGFHAPWNPVDPLLPDRLPGLALALGLAFSSGVATLLQVIVVLLMVWKT